MFQWPSASRTKFKLGRNKDREPNSKRPESKGSQRSPAVRVSARRKYSLPKCGILGDGDRMGLEPRAIEQAEIEPGDLDGTPEARDQMRDQVTARGVGSQGARKPGARGKQPARQGSESSAAIFVCAS